MFGLRALRQTGRPSAAREDAALLGLERTTQLVTTGVYRYIRHPLYASLLLLAWGAFFKAPGRLPAALAGAASVLLYVTAKVEERENVGYFGAAYEAYMRRTRRFMPFLALTSRRAGQTGVRPATGCGTGCCGRGWTGGGCGDRGANWQGRKGNRT